MSEQSPLGDAIAKVEVAFSRATKERKELDLARERRANAFYISLGFTLITAIFYVLVSDHPENTVMAVFFGLLLAGFIFMWGRVMYLGTLYYRVRNSERKYCEDVEDAIQSLSVWKNAI